MRIAAWIAATGVVAATLVGGVAMPASADVVDDGIPLDALDDCGGATDRGGWTVRSFLTTGTDSGVDKPVRPRTLRLSEPCVSAGEVVVPGTVSEVPIEGVSWDGTGWNPPGGSGGGGGGGGGGGVGDEAEGVCTQYEPVTADTVRDRFVECDGSWRAHGFWTNAFCDWQYTEGTVAGGTAVVEPSASGALVTLTVESITPGPTPSGCPVGVGMSIRVEVVIWCEATDGTLYQGTGAQWNFGSDVGDGAEEELLTSCSVGDAPYSLVIVDGYASNVGDTTDSGVAWRADGLEVEVVETLGGAQGSLMYVGGRSPDHSLETYIVCGPLSGGGEHVTTMGLQEWRVQIGPDYLPKRDESDNPVWSHTTTFDLGPWAAVDCERLVSLHVVVCVYHGITADEASCTRTAWSANLWHQRHPYDDGDSDVAMCELVFRPACIDIVYPDRLDPTSWEDMCGSPPSVNWEDFASWVPATIGYYTRCLFVPRGGWDRDGVLATAWEESIVSESVDVLLATADSFNFGETCGVIFEVGSGSPPGLAALQGLKVDTCAWVAWAPPLKAFVIVLAWIGFGMWAIPFVVRTVTSLGTGKSPSPVADEEGRS